MVILRYEQDKKQPENKFMLFYLYTVYLINLQPAGELNGCRSLCHGRHETYSRTVILSLIIKTESTINHPTLLRSLASYGSVVLKC